LRAEPQASGQKSASTRMNAQAVWSEATELKKNSGELVIA
jgi:hypothetical protein